jgi:hypothetical protein
VKLAVVALRAVIPRPSLWIPAARTLARTARRGWWRHPPFLPLPSGEYVRFRMLTNYGDADATPTTDDVVHYLTWCRRWPNRAG